MPTAPNPWTGVSGSSQWTGTTARADLERRMGRAMNGQELQDAYRISGYGDTTGNSAMTADQYNKLLQEGARRSGGTYEGYSSGSSESGTESNHPTWTVENNPTYAGPEYQAQAPFQFNNADFEKDPSYQFRLNEGNRNLQGSAAARGALRGSNTLRSLVDYGQQAASQEFGAAYNRAGQTYDRNQGEHRYDYEQNVGQYDKGYAGRMGDVTARNAAAQRQAELGYDRSWQKDIYNRDDDWRRYQYQNDDVWRRYMEDNANRRFLVQQGNQ